MAAIDHRTGPTLTGKINNIVNANLSGVILYDQNSSVQYSQALAISLLFTL
ncbi:hypothetical protein ACFSUS_15020 [Spirosoma soli]|uniref:Uncharacterized protein n=1 Tax=Spirosoma soli TaxID=1770529 RepID=A0ABW5M4K9_9BACT